MQRTSLESPEEPRMRDLLRALCADPKNHVYLMSSRTRVELEPLLAIPRLGIWYLSLT
jgi:trehalose-6-phosphatase